MAQEENENKIAAGSWWQNCGVEPDAEMLEIDAMQDAIAPLDEQTTRIRELITRFEACYHEADKQAELIVGAIGSGQCPEESHERPRQRKKELEDCYQILSRWCADTAVKDIDSKLGDISAERLLSYIGEANPLKVWQVERIVDKVRSALEPDRPYHMMVFDVREYAPEALPPGEHYKDAAEFLEQTKDTIIRDTVDGREAKMSLAMAVDMLEPCNWDFVGSIITLLKAIGGQLHSERPYVCHQRNLKRSPLCARLEAISNTLGVFWKEGNSTEDGDANLLTVLGSVTPEKRWLAASLDKTIRLQLGATADFWLTLS